MTRVAVHGQGDARLSLTSAILLYSNYQRAGACYATLHPIVRPHRGPPVLGPGSPATVEACAEFAHAIAARGSFAGYIDPHMLYVGSSITVWWRPPGRARVWFECGDQTAVARQIGTRTGITPQPGLVFACARGRWYVFAVKGAARPDRTTRLWRAPYFNVYQTGAICEGNVARPDRVTPDNLAAFEASFFDSRFTHPNDPTRLARHKGGAYALWRSLLDTNPDTWPERTLSPSPHASLGVLIHSLETTR